MLMNVINKIISGKFNEKSSQFILRMKILHNYNDDFQRLYTEIFD